MRGTAALFVALLLVTGPASANTVVNWTETWIEFDGEEWQVTGFMWDQDSEFDIVDLDPVGTPGVIDDPIILAATIVDFQEFAIGTVLEVVVPNFFDPLPKKIVELLFIGQNGGAQRQRDSRSRRRQTSQVATPNTSKGDPPVGSKRNPSTPSDRSRNPALGSQVSSER